MSRSYSEALARVSERRRRILARWREVVEEAAKAVKELYPEARVYLTGSVAEGEAIASSDIDLVVALPRKSRPREAARLIAYVWERLQLPLEHPLEIHVVSDAELEKYKRRGQLIELA